MDSSSMEHLYAEDSKRLLMEECKMDRRIKPSSINVVCTEKCNLICVYCYRKYRRRCENQAGLMHIQQELLNINEMDISEVVLTGGEPLLYPGILDLIHMFRDKSVTILTNGILPIRKLDDVDEIVISLDGTKEDMYLNRGVSSEDYLAIRQNIAYYIRNGKQVSVHCVVTKYNIDNLISWIKQEPFKGQLSFRIVPVSDVYETGIGLTQSQYKVLLETLKIILQDYHFHIDLSTNIVSKSLFNDTVSEEYPVMISPDYNLVTGQYELYDAKYNTYQEMLIAYSDKMRSVSKMILDYLNKEEDSYLFDPYSLAEKLLKEGGN